MTAITDHAAAPTFDVVGLGCCCWDCLGIVPHYPALDEKVGLTALVQQGGGQAGTAMAAVGRLGGKAAIVGRVGEDNFGDQTRSAFLDEGVDVRWLMTVPGATSQFAFIAVDEATGKRTIFYTHGSKGKFDPSELDRPGLLDCRCLLVDGHHNVAALAVAGWSREAGVPLVLDLERPQAEDEQLIGLATHPIIPEQFALALTGAPDAETAAREILRRGCDVAVVTLGARGVVACTPDGTVAVPPYDVEPIVDTTGAGDVFHGAFAYGIALGYELEHNLRFASAVAALKCTQLGGRAGIPTMARALALMASQP